MRDEAKSGGRVREELRSLLTAMQYFTRVPAPAWIGHEPGQLNRAARYFPAIGLLVGITAALVIYAASRVLPMSLAVLLSVVVTTCMTGAFHEDGLADTFDGLGGSATRERALAIMKDSRLGTYGTAALVLTLALKAMALTALPITLACIVSIAAHPLSRWCALIVMDRRTYVRDEQQSRAKPVIDHMTRSQLFIGALSGVTPLVIGAWFVARSPLAVCWWIGIPFAVLIVATLLLMRWFTRRLGGYTGDTLGATQQVTEVLCYLAWVAIWSSY